MASLNHFVLNDLAEEYPGLSRDTTGQLVYRGIYKRNATQWKGWPMITQIVNSMNNQDSAIDERLKQHHPLSNLVLAYYSWLWQHIGGESLIQKLANLFLLTYLKDPFGSTLALQHLLNQHFKAGLEPDGIMGKYTRAAMIQSPQLQLYRLYKQVVAQNNSSMNSGPLLFLNRVPAFRQSAFASKVKGVARDLGISPNWLMGVMELETAGTFDPSITNSIGATGLIQFMPSTALGLGTTTDALRKMSAIEQLDWVKKYYWPFRHRIKRYVDLYLATLLPAALGKPKDWVLQAKGLSPAVIARANPLFDLNKDGQITVGEIEHKLMARIPKEWISYLFDQMDQKKKPLL